MRRILPWFVIALAVGLVLVLSRSGSRSSAPAVEPRPPVPTREVSEPSRAVEVVAPEPTVERVAQPPSASPAPRRPSKDAVSALTLSGRVVDDLGTPVPEFTLELGEPGAKDDLEALGLQGLDPETLAALRGRKGAKRRTRAFANPEGTFAFDVPSRGQWQLTASAPGGRRSAPAVLDVPDESEGLVLVLARAASIAGFVVGSSGAPVAEARLFLLYPGEDEPPPHLGHEPEPRTRSETTGRFHIEGVLPGRLRILTQHPEHSDVVTKEFTVAPGGRIEDLEIVLAQGGRIEGHAEPSLGDVAEREIGLFSFRGFSGWRDARTDSAGRFVLEHVVPQDYVIELRPAGYGKSGFEDQPGIRKNIHVLEGQTTRVVFGEARRAIAVSGRVTIAGAPAPGLKVRANSRENEDRGEEVETGADGAFALTVHGAGEYVFSVSANYGSDVFFERKVPDQDAVDFPFEVPGGALLGRVVDAQGLPLGRVGVTAERSGWTDRESFYRDHYSRTYTAADGTFAFRLLAAGTYTLRAPDGFQSDSPPPRVPHGRRVLADLQLGATEVSGLELRLPPESRVSGVVVDEQGNPVTDGWVRLLDEHGLSLSGTWETRTDATGHFQIDSVGPGTYRVRVRAGERDVTGEPFAVEERTVGTRVELR